MARGQIPSQRHPDVLRDGGADVIHQPMIDVAEHLAGWRASRLVVDAGTNLHSR